MSPKAHTLAGGIPPAAPNLDGQWVPRHPHTQPEPETGVRTPHTGQRVQGDPKVIPSTSWVGGAGGRASRPILTGTLRGTQPWGSSLK